MNKDFKENSPNFTKCTECGELIRAEYMDCHNIHCARKRAKKEEIDDRLYDVQRMQGLIRQISNCIDGQNIPKAMFSLGVLSEMYAQKEEEIVKELQDLKNG